MKIAISELIPTHNELRNPYWFVKSVKSGHHLSFDKPTLLNTPDNVYYILDGHHRLAYYNYWNPDKTLELDNCNVVTYSYNEMNEINLEVGYVTPFDVRIECRHSNFMLFKNTVLAMRRGNYISESMLSSFIRNNRHLYVEQRRVYCLKDLYADIVDECQ